MLQRLLIILLLAACQSSPPKSDFYSEDHLHFKEWKREPNCCTATGNKAAIASGGSFSSKAGSEMLKNGGNLVDAAIATAFGLAVERPFSCGLGGGGFFLYRTAKGKNYFYDFRETAPLKAHRDLFVDKEGKIIPEKSTVGGAAIATPGFVKGLHEIHRKFGKLPWPQVLAPAIILADKGFPVYVSFAKKINGNKEKLELDPYLKSLFQNKKGEWLKEGELFTQTELAQTLKEIAAHGPRAFYSGTIAKKIIEAAQKREGILQLKDLQNYRVKQRTPIFAKWQGMELISAPPPSSGGTLIAMMLNALPSLKLTPQTPLDETIDGMAKIMRKAYLERGIFGDPDFVGHGYKKLLKQSPPEDKGTAHLSAIDDQGNAIASTLTINDSFGAFVGVPGTGILLNNEMDDFSSKPGAPNTYGLIGSVANSIQPNKRPVSSMSPTILIKNNKPVLAIGGAGGSRIISSVFQTIYHWSVTHPQDLQKSIFMPRVHHQGKPEQLDLEEAFPGSVESSLKAKGHTLSDWAWLANVEAVGKNAQGNWVAVFDPRDEGGAEVTN